MTRLPCFGCTIVKKLTLLLACTGLLVLLISVSCPVVNAAPKNSLKVSPAFIEIDTQTVSGSKQFPIAYTNTSEKPIQITLFFMPVTFADDAERIEFPINQSVLASHLIPSSNTFTIAPRETKNIVLTPNDFDLLADSDYYEALVAKMSTTEQKAKPSTAVIGNITTLLLVRNSSKERHPVYLLTEPIRILPAVSTTIPTTVSFIIRNGGATYGTPRGKMEIKDMFGRVLASGIINGESTRIFPNTKRLVRAVFYQESVPLPLHFGNISLSIRDEYSSQKDSTINRSQTYVFIDPIFALVLLVVIVLSLLYAVSQTKKRKHHLDTSPSKI